MTTREFALASFAVAVIGLVGAPVAEAAAIRVFDPATNTAVVINDQDVLLDESPAPGVVQHTGFAFANFMIDFELGITKPANLITPTAPIMQLSVAASSNSATTQQLVIDFSETDFGPSGNLVVTSATGVTLGNVVYQTFQDTSNGLFGGTLLTTDSSGGPAITMSNGTTLSSTGFPYSLTQRWTITHGPGVVVTSVDPSLLVVSPFVAPVPDGGWAVGLLGFALMGVEGLRRKHTRL